MSISESAMVRQVMADDPEKNSIYVGDQGLGVYRSVQAAEASQHKVVLRIQKRTAKMLWKAIKSKTPLVSGTEHNVTWKPQAHIKVEPDLPSESILGRLIYMRIQQDGFRPIDVYLFTTLLDDVKYSLYDICDLYSRRWQVEIDLRQVKTTLEMEQFEVKSVEMFKKELIAGLLTYNLIHAFMLQAAIKAGTEVIKLSFSKCVRRIRKVFVKGVPAFVKQG
nr:transposase [Deltaproteobacteria bacterium]